jgi:hypothetical protein
MSFERRPPIMAAAMFPPPMKQILASWSEGVIFGGLWRVN